MKYRSHGFLAMTAFSAAVALTLAGCSGGGGIQTLETKAPTRLSGSVSLWHYWTDREAKAVQSVVDDFEKANPGVKVEVHTAQGDDKVAKAIASGGNIDVAWASTPDRLGTFCASGAFRDLGPYIKRDQVDMSQFSDVARSSTSFNGTQCSLPSLADIYGLFYNTDLLKAAGYTEPPKTLGELETMALKLTTYNPDGSIKTLGFNPMMGFYENRPTNYAPAAGATWMKDGKSALSNQPGWKELMTWQKGFVDKIGYQKLKAFTAGLGDEWSANNAFQTGQVAMNVDGEWRVAFVADQKPELRYATAPFPAADAHTDLYGGGFSVVNIVGIAKGSKNPELAWALAKYLTTDTAALVKLANAVTNIPPTKAALNSPDLKQPEQFKTFLSMAASPHLATAPATVIGSASQDTLATYWYKYQAGTGGDLTGGLTKVEKDINDALALSKGP